MNLEYLLRTWRATADGDEPDLQALYMATLTLTRMAEGGLYDQAVVTELRKGWSSQDSKMYQAPIQLIITADPEAAEGNYTARVTVIDEGNGEELGNVSFIFKVRITYDIMDFDVSPIYKSTGPGQPAKFAINITNKGSTSDVFIVIAEGPKRWEFTILSDSSGVNPVLEVYNTVATNATTAIIRQTTAGGNGNQDIGLLVDIQGSAVTDRIANFRYSDGTTYTSRMAIMRGGNVGIGTSSPDGKLNIIAANTYSAIRSNSSGAFTFLSLGRTASELEIGVSGRTDQFFSGTVAGDAIIKQNITGKIHLGYGSSAPSITINSSNNVGIGTTAPVQKLDVRGNAYIVGTTSNSTASGLVVANSAESTLFCVENSGNVGIGTTA